MQVQHFRLPFLAALGGFVIGAGPLLAQQAKVQVAPPVQVQVVPAPMQVIIGPQGVVGQPGQPGQVDDKVTGGRIKLPVDPRSRRRIEEAKRYVTSQEWSNAVKVLQSLLDASEDTFLPETDEDQGRRGSVKAEANLILGSMPKEGKQFYEQQFGQDARKLLEKARASSDYQMVNEVAQRFLFTEAGTEAAGWLGGYHLDHGRYMIAALFFGRLLDRDPSGQNLSPQVLLQTAIAFARTKNEEKMKKAMTLLLNKLSSPNQKIPAAMRNLDEAKLLTILKNHPTAAVTATTQSWPMYQGNIERSAIAQGSIPFLESRIPFFSLNKAQENQLTLLTLKDARKSAKSAQIIPGMHPIVVQDKILFRTHWGVAAIDPKTGDYGKTGWPSVPSHVSLSGLLSSNVDEQVRMWAEGYKRANPGMLLENTLLGTLSSDQTLVYGVDDIAIPPMPEPYYGRGGMRSTLNNWNYHNKLSAWDVDTGKLAFQLGSVDDNDPTYAETFFLGPPLPLGEHLYQLAESNAELKLLCLKVIRDTFKDGERTKSLYRTEHVWSQPLGMIDRKLSEDPLRRTQAAHLAYADGVLVCSTNAGTVLGFDLLTRTLIWSFQYPNETVNTNEMDPNMGFAPIRRRGGWGNETTSTFQPQWASTAPIISQGKLLLTPSDGKFLQMLDLREGKLKWSVPRVPKEAGKKNQSYLYVAGVTENRVIVVGRQTVDALDINSGAIAWSVPLPKDSKPSGRGILTATQLFVPISFADPSTQNELGELLAFQLSDGKLQYRSRVEPTSTTTAGSMPEDFAQRVLGNLIFIGDDLVSLNSYGLAIYPQLSAKEKQIETLLTSNQNDPEGLAQKAAMQLSQGQTEASVATFRTALKNNPKEPSKRLIQSKLFDAQLDVMEKDFAKHMKDLPELEKLIELIPDEGESESQRLLRESRNRIRRLRFIKVAGAGFEKLKQVPEAIAIYRSAVKLGRNQIPSPDAVNNLVLPDRWASEKIHSLYSSLQGEAQGIFDNAMTTEWKTLEGEANPQKVLDFAQIFGMWSLYGQKAHLWLAESQFKQGEVIPAEVNAMRFVTETSTKYDPQTAANAIELLTRIHLKSNDIPNAIYYFKMLGQRYSAVTLPDGRKVQQLIDALRLDRRFLPYLSFQRTSSVLEGDYEIKKLSFESYNQGSPLVLLTPTSNPAVNKRIILERLNNSLKVVIYNQENAQPAFTVPIPLMSFSQNEEMGQMTQYYYKPIVRVTGSLLCFQHYGTVYVVDHQKGKLLWNTNVLPDDNNNINRNYAVENNGRVVRFLPNGNKEVLGMLGPVSQYGMCMSISGEGLVCFDLRTQEKRWSRGDISTATELFGDEEVVVVVPLTEAANRATVFSIRDGREITTDPAWMEALPNRTRTLGRYFLTGKNSKGKLELFDCKTGKAVWSKSIPDKALVLQNMHQQDFAGYCTSTGQLEVFDLMTGNTIFQGKMETFPPNIVQVHAFQDEQRWFFVSSSIMNEFNRVIPAGKNAEGTKNLNYAMVHSSQAVPVQGRIAAFSRSDSKAIWEKAMPTCYLASQEVKGCPMLFAIANVKETEVKLPANANQGGVNEYYRNFIYFYGVDKRNGEILESSLSSQGSYTLSAQMDQVQGIAHLITRQGRQGYQFVPRTSLTAEPKP